MNKAFKSCKLTNNKLTKWSRFYKRQYMVDVMLIKLIKWK